MFSNYLKIAWRNMVRNRIYALINISGLGIGIGCALLLFALVRYHYRVDTHHTKFDRIYRFGTTFTREGNVTSNPGVPYAFGQSLRTDHPEIERVAMISEWDWPVVIVPGKSTASDRKFKEAHEKGAFVEPTYFQIFDYTWLSGGPVDLNQPGTLVLSASAATKYFGTTNPLGRTLKLSGRTPARVVGVFADYADNTDYPYQLMPSWATLTQTMGHHPEEEHFDNINSSTLCFITLDSRYSPANWTRDGQTFLKKHNPERIKETTYALIPLANLHFDTLFGAVNESVIWSLFVVGLFLVITACINFVNLATAQALNRSREVGVRKVLGSTRGQLLGQFMGETALIVALAMGIAVIIFRYGLSLAHTYLNGAFKFAFLFTPSVLGWVALLLAGVVLLAGLYPALILAGFRPMVALAGKISARQAGGFTVRRGLVVAQFAISQVLIIGLIVVASQLHFVQTKDLGFQKEAMLTIELPYDQNEPKQATFRNLVTALPDVAQFSYSMGGAPQSGWVSKTDIRYDSRPEKEKFNPQQLWIDADYAPLYQLKLVAGRNLYPSDTAREVLINETMVRKLGFHNPTQLLGKRLHKSGVAPLGIVGVLKDFNQNDLKEPIGPSFFTTIKAGYTHANIQLKTANYKRVIGQLERIYSRTFPDNFFAADFVDDQIRERYKEEQTMGRLVNFFAAVALFIGCMGLYGLVLFMVAQRTKEIGVRKVLGASVGSILWLFNREFVRLIAVAFVLAIPVAWWAMTHWLALFAYHIELGPAIFGVALLATVLVALLTVSFQSVRAAIMNPVKSLRSE